MVLEQPHAVTEQQRDKVDLKLVEEPGLEVLLDDVRAAGHDHVLVRGSGPGLLERRQVDFMNWNAPRYSPPPPMAFGSPPDSHSLVDRAQRLSRGDTASQRRTYLASLSETRSSLRVPSFVETPPELPAEAVEGAAHAATTAAPAISFRTVLGLELATPCEGFTLHALSLLTGLADGLAPKSRRYAAIRPRFAPTSGSPDDPRYVAGRSAVSAAD